MFQPLFSIEHRWPSLQSSGVTNPHWPRQRWQIFSSVFATCTSSQYQSRRRPRLVYRSFHQDFRDFGTSLPNEQVEYAIEHKLDVENIGWSLRGSLNTTIWCTLIHNETTTEQRRGRKQRSFTDRDPVKLSWSAWNTIKVCIHFPTISACVGADESKRRKQQYN